MNKDQLRDATPIFVAKNGTGFVADNEGIYNFITKNFIFKTLWQRGSGSKRRLIISLSAGSRSNVRTSSGERAEFNRWTWGHYVDSDMWCIEDPMYDLYPGVTCGWFYGTAEDSALSELADLIERMINFLSLENHELVFLGSDSGGYAALYLANHFNGSKAITFCPQLRPGMDARVSRKFEDQTGIDLSAPDEKFLRNDLSYIADNKTSRFLITCSSESHRDFDEQIWPLMNRLGIAVDKERVTLNGKGNFTFCLAQLEHMYSPHNLMYDVKYFPEFLEYLDGKLPSSVLEELVASQEQEWEEHENCRFVKFWYSVLHNCNMSSFMYPRINKSRCELHGPLGYFVFIYGKDRIDCSLVISGKFFSGCKTVLERLVNERKVSLLDVNNHDNDEVYLRFSVPINRSKNMVFNEMFLGFSKVACS